MHVYLKLVFDQKGGVGNNQVSIAGKSLHPQEQEVKEFGESLC